MPFADPIPIRGDLLSVVTCGQEDQMEYPKLVISRIEAISQCLANVEAATVSLTSTIMSEFEDIFASLDLQSHDSPTQPSVAVVSPTRWLLDNLHNPYPPNAIKRNMEDSPELDSRTVNEWFARARQRIGWTRLLRDRFGGCRSAATDAAFRVFVRDDPRSPLDAELYAAFVAMKAHANLVYTLPSPGILEITLYPSPPSRCPSATPSLTYSTDSEGSDDDASQPSRKRKRSCSELPSDPHTVSAPSRKRRSASPPEQASHPLPLSHTPAQNVSSPSRSRKRRLSESHSNEAPAKKPRGLGWSQRKQTISDPLPLHTPLFDWESWCTEAFAVPPSATTNLPVPDALDFELFNFEAFPASQPTDQSEIYCSSSYNSQSTLSYIVNPPVDTRTGFPEQPNAQVDSLCIAPSQTEKDLWPTSWEDFFNVELPCQSTPLSSLTNSSSSPDTLWSLSPPELPYFDSFESPLLNFASPSLFKIPTLYPADDVEIVDNSLFSP